MLLLYLQNDDLIVQALDNDFSYARQVLNEEDTEEVKRLFAVYVDAPPWRVKRLLG